MQGFDVSEDLTSDPDRFIEINTPEIPEENLQAQKGDPDLENRDRLFSQFQPLVRRLVNQYAGKDQEMRQDLQGEIYYRFSVLFDQFDPERGVPLRAYLVRQLTYSVYVYARHHWRNARRETNIDDMMQRGEPGELVDPTAQWIENLNLKRIIQTLPDAILKLPSRQRQIIIWRYYDLLSYEEIALNLNIRVPSARSLLRHGLNNLRRIIGDRA
jgi:RNA polymerase sigma factor (sigma-70 family)